MALVRKVLCFALFVIGVANAGVLPVGKCKLEDSKCMKVEFQKAVPFFMLGLSEVGVEVLDVMNMNDVKFDLSGLQFSLAEGKLEGLKAAVIDDVKWDLEKKQFVVDCHLDALLKGHYTAAGRILILPITGDGQFTLKLTNMQIKFIIDYEMVKGADGKEYVKPTKVNFEFNVKDNAHFDLTGLFNGNKELSDGMLKFLNENWEQITVEFGQPLVGSAIGKLFKNIKTFLAKQAISDIALV